MKYTKQDVIDIISRHFNVKQILLNKPYENLVQFYIYHNGIDKALSVAFNSKWNEYDKDMIYMSNEKYDFRPHKPYCSINELIWKEQLKELINET